MITACRFVPATLLALGAVCWAADASAQQTLADSLRSTLDAFREQHRVPGLSVAAGFDGHVVWSGAVGVADLSSEMPATPTTRFRIGPVSMAVTSALVGAQVEDGRLDLDADVHRYVSAFPKKPYRVTGRQLAGHLGGIRHWQGDEYRSNVAYTSVTDALTMFAKDTLLYEPGTRQTFSVLGWTLLSAALEGAGKADFLLLLQREVLDPLEMVGTGPDLAGDVPNRATFYELVDERVQVAPPVDNSHKWAGAGLVSTPTDLVRFGMALCRGELLAPETVEMLWTSMKTSEGIETGYGIGWMVGRDADERRVVSHTGSPVGGRAILLVYPDDCSAVALTANLAGIQFGGLPQTILARLRAGEGVR